MTTHDRPAEAAAHTDTETGYLLFLSAGRQKRVREENVTDTQASRRGSRPLDSRVKALKAEGRSIREIAVALKVPKSTVARAITSG